MSACECGFAGNMCICPSQGPKSPDEVRELLIGDLQKTVTFLRGECERWTGRVKELESRLDAIRDVADGRVR